MGLGVPGFNPIALRKAKIVYNFGLSECNRDKYIWVSNIQKPKNITFSFALNEKLMVLRCLNI